jgi:hypothetical protein
MREERKKLFYFLRCVGDGNGERAVNREGRCRSLEESVSRRALQKDEDEEPSN